jgi:membrane protein implicated in regulation of membrane protease activity
MEFDIVYWHWVVFGIGLILLELIIPSFTALWFGIGGVAVGVLLMLIPDIGITAQVILWSIFSGTLTLAWYKFFKKTPHREATLEDVFGIQGLVIRSNRSSNHGQVRFSTPLMGKDEWEFTCSGDIAVGEQVSVNDIQNEILSVTKSTNKA